MGAMQNVNGTLSSILGQDSGDGINKQATQNDEVAFSSPTPLPPGPLFSSLFLVVKLNNLYPTPTCKAWLLYLPFSHD